MQLTKAFANKAIDAEASACATLRENGTAPASGYPRARGPASKVRSSFEGAHHFLKVRILENAGDSFEDAHPFPRCARKSAHLRIWGVSGTSARKTASWGRFALNPKSKRI